MGETDKHWKEISCVPEVERERGKEIGEGDKTESKNNLCRYTFNKHMWERGVCQGVRQGVSRKISAKVTLGKRFSFTCRSDLCLWHYRGNTNIWLWMQRPRKGQVRRCRPNRCPEELPRSSPRELQLTHWARLERSHRDVRKHVRVGRAEGMWADTSARGKVRQRCPSVQRRYWRQEEREKSPRITKRVLQLQKYSQEISKRRKEGSGGTTLLRGTVRVNNWQPWVQQETSKDKKWCHGR